jgi:hypothetical protein
VCKPWNMHYAACLSCWTKPRKPEIDTSCVDESIQNRKTSVPIAQRMDTAIVLAGWFSIR